MSTPLLRLLKKERHTLNGWIRTTQDKEYRDTLKNYWETGIMGNRPLRIIGRHSSTRIEVLF